MKTLADDLKEELQEMLSRYVDAAFDIDSTVSDVDDLVDKMIWNFSYAAGILACGYPNDIHTKAVLINSVAFHSALIDGDPFLECLNIAEGRMK